MAQLLFLILLYCQAFLAGIQEPNPQSKNNLGTGKAVDCGTALADLQKINVGDSRNEDALTTIGICQTRLGHPERATAAFERMVGLNPNGWLGWLNLGTNHMALKKFQDAEMDFEKAVKLTPANEIAWFNLGVARHALGRNQDSFQALDRAHTLAPGNTQIDKAWREGASLLADAAAELLDKKEYAPAESLLLQVQAPLQSSARWHNLLGYADFKMGKNNSALEHLQRALHMEPENEQLLMDLGEFLISNGAYDAARKLFEVGVKKHPDSAPVAFVLALANQLDEKTSEAIVLLKAIVASHPGFELAYSALGTAYQNKGDWEALVNLGKKLQAVNSSNPSGFYMVGVGLLGESNDNRSLLPEAISALERSVVLGPNFMGARFQLGKAYMADGSDERAEEELKETLRLNPRWAGAHYLLARIYQRTGKPDQSHKEMEQFEKGKELEAKEEKKEALRFLLR